jgi:ABC-2 type transport system permease protein
MTSFFSPVAYIVAAIFLIATGYLFMSDTLVEGSEATMRLLLNNMAMVLVFAIPLLTMRVLSDEYASGTIEALMTAPVTDIEVILGKFLGVFVFYTALLLSTLIFVGILFRYGANDFNLVALGYLGMLLLGALYVSIGIFASALTRYQLVAALIGIALLGLLTRVVDYLAGLQSGVWRVTLSYLNILHQFDDFSKGIFDSQSFVFFISATIFFLFLAVKVLESRRWR